MKSYITQHEWKIIESTHFKEYNQITESLMSIGNGRMGQRGNFEEGYSGPTLSGSYNAGVYYPDLTRVGWWKNGYPEYFAKVLNSVNWIGIGIEVDGRALDLYTAEIEDYVRELDMQKGLLRRSFTYLTKEHKRIHFQFERFIHFQDKDLGAVQLEIRSEDFTGVILVSPYLDFDVENQDSNYDEKFWLPVDQYIDEERACVMAKTKKTDFWVGCAMVNSWQGLAETLPQVERGMYLEQPYRIQCAPGSQHALTKYVNIQTSLYQNKEDIFEAVQQSAMESSKQSYAKHRQSHTDAWEKQWEQSDIVIDGDVAAQQGIRFNIFQLWSTYTGDDPRLNIGPKGFTGEKYGGSTYWDTEAYCLPFYLSTLGEKVGKQLLVYRYQHLDKAIENATKLGFTDGAALYPMVTMNGEECHNEWEITFEEIHRNGAIAYAIYRFIAYTGDNRYLFEGGLEVLVAIARFWAQRVNWSEPKQQYVMLGVTGPNEYENNVNNNWYTNYIARWCLQYTMQAIDEVKTDKEVWNSLQAKMNWSEAEQQQWQRIVDHMFLPVDDTLGIFLQQEGYLDKEQILVDDLPASDRPLNQKWSWDRILRSCFIKQADVLQGLYFFEDHFDRDQHLKNFTYYEPRTVHESSLSPCVHSILAAKLGLKEKAYEMYLRTARLDLDDYNNDTEDGCHITSMAGTWMAVVEGFGGMRVRNGQLVLSPYCPPEWKFYQFTIRFRGHVLSVKVEPNKVELHNHCAQSLNLLLRDEHITIASNGMYVYKL